MFVLVSKLSEWNYMFIILSNVPIEMGWLMKTWKRGKLNESAKHDCGFYYGHRDIAMEPNFIKYFSENFNCSNAQMLKCLNVPEISFFRPKINSMKSAIFC